MTQRPELTHLVQQLHATFFFKGLSEAILTRLAHEAVWRTYAAGEVVFLEGEASAGLYYLHSGWLKVVKTSPEGREQVLQFIGPGETFNSIGAFANRPNPATALALEPAGIWVLKREGLAHLLREQPEVAQRVIEEMADRMIHLVKLVEDLSLRSVTGRLARMLLNDAPEGVLPRPKWYTQTELAARLGTVPDVVQRALSNLAFEGIIEVERQAIRLRDRTALEKLAS